MHRGERWDRAALLRVYGAAGYDTLSPTEILDRMVCVTESSEAGDVFVFPPHIIHCAPGGGDAHMHAPDSRDVFFAVLESTSSLPTHAHDNDAQIPLPHLIGQMWGFHSFKFLVSLERYSAMFTVEWEDDVDAAIAVLLSSVTGMVHALLREAGEEPGTPEFEEARRVVMADLAAADGGLAAIEDHIASPLATLYL